MTRTYLAIAAAVGLFAHPLWAQTDASPPSQDELQAAMNAPQGFADRATSSNMFEILTSELALSRSQSDAVRAFAEKMIADHEAASEQMKAATAEEGVTLPDSLMPDHQEQLDRLSSLEVADFDAAYLGAQLAAHTEAITLFRGFAEQGADGALKDFATDMLPMLEEHLDAARRLSDG